MPSISTSSMPSMPSISIAFELDEEGVYVKFHLFFFSLNFRIVGRMKF